MRVYQDRCKELNFSADVIGIYNEWTLSAALTFPLLGIILEQADITVRTAVQQVLKQLNNEGIYHHSLMAKFLTKDEMMALKTPNLTNQRLFDFH